MRCEAHDALGQCERQAGNHPAHSYYYAETGDFVDWPNSEYVAPPPRKGTREQQDARTRKKLRDMAERTNQATKPKQKFFPTENDRLGRTALYLRKYKGKWISLEELEMKTVGGTGANLCLTTLINRYGWEIKAKVQVKDARKFVMLVSE